MQLQNIEAIEKRLWEAADTLRTNSNYASNEYFLPVMGLVFLRHAYSRYPALYKRRFPKEGRSPDEHDAWSIAFWLQEADRRGTLDRYFEPPLTFPERKQAILEGWILEVW